MYPRITLKSTLKKTFLGHRHPWIFSGAIASLEKPKADLHGQLVSVFVDEIFLGHGYYSRCSQIAVRFLSFVQDEVIDQTFFENKIRQAVGLREKYVLNAQNTACRLIFAESDFLPGFIVDKYNDNLVLQIHTLGAENLKTTFVNALRNVVNPACIYEKSDNPSRKIEGLEKEQEKLILGELPAENSTFLENDMQFLLDFTAGQKTGFFLDQRTPRLALQKYVANKKVLNLCGYTGGFSVSALLGGAKSVTTVDISQRALDICKKNIEKNGFGPDLHTEVCADIFDFYKTCKRGDFDIIILDPPAFIKSKKDFDAGLKAYISANQHALQLLNDGGVLATFSCSSLLSGEQFFRMLSWASQASACHVQVLETFAQGADHPMTPYFPEGIYLKGYALRKSDY